jgi:hypothetical protein
LAFESLHAIEALVATLEMGTDAQFHEEALQKKLLLLHQGSSELLLQMLWEENQAPSDEPQLQAHACWDLHLTC